MFVSILEDVIQTNNIYVLLCGFTFFWRPPVPTFPRPSVDGNQKQNASLSNKYRRKFPRRYALKLPSSNSVMHLKPP